LAEAWVARANSAARTAIINRSKGEEFFMVVTLGRGSWNLVEIFSSFESSGVFTSYGVDEIFSELFFKA
jgi:hypothetical protein